MSLTYRLRMRNVRTLDVATHARSLAIAIYAITARFPTEERYGLAAQMRRAVVSVMSNIAEGAGRGGEREFVQFLYLALGSARELAAQVDLAIALGFIGANESVLLSDRVDHMQRMLNRLSADRRRKLDRASGKV